MPTEIGAIQYIDWLYQNGECDDLAGKYEDGTVVAISRDSVTIYTKDQWECLLQGIPVRAT